MNVTAATSASHLHAWRPAQPERHMRCMHVKALGREKALPCEGWTASVRRVLEAG